MRCPARAREGDRGAGIGGRDSGRTRDFLPRSPHPEPRSPIPPSLAPRRGGCMSLRQRVLRSTPLIGFGLGIVFLILSLAGYDPADPPGRGAEPANAQPTNPCGPVGAVLAHAMFTTLGWSSWLIPPAMLGVNLLLVRRRALPDRAIPSIGFAIVLVAAAATVHKVAPTLWPSPPVGSGGYVGALLAVFLERSVGNAGLALIL